MIMNVLLLKSKQVLLALVYLHCLFLFVALNASAADSEEWVYTVKPGDNLWKLSKRHLVRIRYWKEIKELNKIDDPANLKPGSTVRFPVKWLKSGASVGKLVTISGEVKIVERFTGVERPAQKEMLLWNHDMLHTRAGGNATVQFSDGSKILVQENSTLLMEDLKSYGDTGLAETKVSLQGGRVHNKVVPQQGSTSRFEIATPSAIAAVRGTEYRLSAEKNGESKAEVVSGEVGVDGGGVSQAVSGGYGTLVQKESIPVDPVRLLSPPDMNDLLEVITRVPFPVNMKPVEGAVSYRVQISADEEFDSLAYDSVFANNKTWGPDLPNGSYYLRLRAIDERGLEGLDTIIPFDMQAHPIPPLQLKPAPGAAVQTATPAFRWSEPEEAESYSFQLSRDPDYSQLLVDEYGYKPASLTITKDISPGVYFWRVASIDMAEQIGPYNSQQFRVTPPSPDMSASSMDDTEMVFRWHEGESGQKYHCQIARDAEFASLVVDEKIAEPQYPLSDFQSGVYFIRVATVDADGYAGPFSAYQKVSVPEPPPPWWAYLFPVILAVAVLL